jgi:hypothetical protein
LRQHDRIPFGGSTEGRAPLTLISVTITREEDRGRTKSAGKMMSMRTGRLGCPWFGIDWDRPPYMHIDAFDLESHARQSRPRKEVNFDRRRVAFTCQNSFTLLYEIF